MQFRQLVFALIWPQNLCHTQTDRHFVKIVNLCSGHPKMCKSIKNQFSQFQYFLILNIEESKNKILKHFLQCGVKYSYILWNLQTLTMNSKSWSYVEEILTLLVSGCSERPIDQGCRKYPNPRSRFGVNFNQQFKNWK